MPQQKRHCQGLLIPWWLIIPTFTYKRHPGRQWENDLLLCRPEHQQAISLSDDWQDSPPPLEVPKQLWQQTNNNSTSPSMIWCQSGANELLAYLCELEVLPVLALNASCWPKDTNPNASLRRGSEPLGPFQGHIFTKISRQMYRWKMHIHQHDLHAHLQVFEKKVCFPVENSAPSILTKPHFTNACCPNLSKTNQGTKEILCGPLCHNIMQKLMSGTCCSIHFHTFSTVYPIFLSPFVKS